MRIGINAMMFQDENKTGIPIAVENVLRCWSEKYPENEYYLFAWKKLHLDIKWGENWHQAASSNKLVNRLIAGQGLPSKGFRFFYSKLYRLLLPLLIKRNKLDVFWAPNYFLPVKLCGCRTKYVVSIYDMAMFRFKDIVVPKVRIKHEVRLPAAKRRADKIITISRASAEDIHEFLGVRKSKIFISYLGGLYKSEKRGKVAYNESMKPELDIKGRFILFISTIEPRKNIITLIRAFEKYLDRYHEEDLYLVLAGGRGWKCDDIYLAAETSRYSDRIIMPGYISSDEKAYLLSEASVFAYPSLYEGFGLPVLEAFESRIPLVTANNSSLPEVAGDAAYYIDDPFDADALAEQLRCALTVSGEERRVLEEKMERRLGKFSWEKNAAEIMRMFKRLDDDAHGRKVRKT